MKIVHWAKFYPPEWGGTERVTYDEANAAAAAGHDVAVVAFTRGAAGSEIRHGVQVERASVVASIDSQPLSWRWLVLAVRRGRGADLIHIHTPNLLAALALVLIPSRVRIILQWQTDLVEKGLLGRLAWPLERYMVHRAERILASSPAYALASPVMRRFPAKTLAIPLGIADPALAPAADRLPAFVADFVGGRPLALAVGRAVPYKGFEYLIRAAAELRADAAVVIVGTGPLEPAHRALIEELGVGGRVLLAGRLSAADLNALFRAATLYVMCSVKRSEAFGLVLLEAMGHGLPTVATDIAGSGVAWVAGEGETGRIVPPRDPARLAAAIDDILSDPVARAAYGARARARYERLFTRERMLDAVLALYRGGEAPAPRRHFGDSRLEAADTRP
jgi:glycosyltransferase involved in cell wall biosynthesis